jgi:hypothetical protein
MSGYRNLHRQQVVFHKNDEHDDGTDVRGATVAATDTDTDTDTDTVAIWSICTTPTFSDMMSTLSTNSSNKNKNNN